MPSFEITLFGDIVPQGRPRFTKAGRCYTDKKSRAWKEQIQAQIRPRLDGLVFAQGVPLEMMIEFELEKPKSVKRVEHTVKPDIDNLAKAIMDAFNGLVYHDDSQIVCLEVSKSYAHKDAHGSVRVSIHELEYA